MKTARALGVLAGALALLFTLEASAQESSELEASWYRGTRRRE